MQTQFNLTELRRQFSEHCRPTKGSELKIPSVQRMKLYNQNANENSTVSEMMAIRISYRSFEGDSLILSSVSDIYGFKPKLTRLKKISLKICRHY